eukprot:gb/GEZN01010239.1/.p1 GENE.gb/GEZN01010239.1/~~gb/GEZN01010239.1/.p1  ORF type:complete len:290 (+),score=11.65 gb/GEZN01010239.1/:22-891(+)
MRLSRSVVTRMSTFRRGGLPSLRDGSSRSFSSSALPPPSNYLIDMDGVLLEGEILIPGAEKFIERLNARGAKYLVLTNNPIFTPADLQDRLNTAGLPITRDHIYTSALATAKFLHKQRPNGKAYVIGGSGLTTALHEIGYILTSHKPDYVVVGESNNYSYEEISLACRLVRAGARFIATNPDVVAPHKGGGVVPATGALCALIQAATGIAPYSIGKPNPLMMRTALEALGVHSQNTFMVGDRMDTDVKGGMEAGMSTILVLSGTTKREGVEEFAYRPTLILNSVADIEV